jgi:hypothetical protein
MSQRLPRPPGDHGRSNKRKVLSGEMGGRPGTVAPGEVTAELAGCIVPRLGTSVAERSLIWRIAAENPTWGEERIADELLLKLQIRLSPRTVGKYIKRGHAALAAARISAGPFHPK